MRDFRNYSATRCQGTGGGLLSNGWLPVCRIQTIVFVAVLFTGCTSAKIACIKHVHRNYNLVVDNLVRVDAPARAFANENNDYRADGQGCIK